MAHRWIATAPGGPEVLAFEEYAVPPPRQGEVTIEVRAAGVNPADLKHVARGEPQDFPKPIGYEVAGVITAIGPDTSIATGGGVVRQEVIAYRVTGGWATALTARAADVFEKPPSLSFEAAANLILVGATASEMVHVADVAAGETILVHAASGAVGVSVLQQAALLGARVVGTASERNFDLVRRYGGVPVAYGDGLEQRVGDAAPEGVAAALDCIGTDEAVDTSLALVSNRARIVTIAAAHRAQSDGIRAIAGAMPASQAYRDAVRADLIRLAAEGRLEVPVARTYPLADALAAVELLLGQRPGGKIALIP
jgi:NADPH:quinone reductase-like Zn-dependent oxidoreductase